MLATKNPKYHEMLLIVEDSDEDFNTLNRLLKQLQFTCPIHRCCDGDEVIDFLNRTGQYKKYQDDPLPSLILLDLNLPGMDGIEVVSQLKKDDVFQKIPVIVWTTSNNPTDVDNCYRNGANSYLTKLMKIEEMREAVRTFIHYWFEYSVLPVINN